MTAKARQPQTPARIAGAIHGHALEVAGGYCVADHYRYQAIGGPASIISEEDPASVLLNRVSSLIAGHGWDQERDSAARSLPAVAPPTQAGGRDGADLPSAPPQQQVKPHERGNFP